MSRVLPILFNTEMVTAIPDERKTETRRVVKYKYSNTEMKMHKDKYGERLIEIQKDVEGETYGKNPDGSTWHKLLGYIEPKSPYQPGDILYVRETWAFIPCIECRREGSCDRFPFSYEDKDSVSEGCYIYRAEHAEPERITWRPSIHMPKEAARIFLKVTGVRVERLQEMTLNDFLNEGISIPYEAFNDPDNAYMQSKKRFIYIWNSTINKKHHDLYGWDANPWVWVIKFEKCERPKVW